MTDEREVLRFESGVAAATVDVGRGGRISSLRIGDIELMARHSVDPTGWGCFLMAPFAGRLDRGRLHLDGVDHQLPITMAPHAIHGTVADTSGVAVDDHTVRLDLGPLWPVAGHVLHTVHLADDHLTLRLEVRTDAGPFPASCGWHPWFPRRLGEVEVDIALSATSMLTRGNDGLPNGNRATPPPPGPWDDCFDGIIAPTVLDWPGVLRLEIDSDADYLVVYDEQPDVVCVEPQTAPPNDLTRMVTADTPLVTTTTWRWQVS